ncbi:MAG: FIST C-terminal domain-containing protein [Leptospiraceae bacterium]|nr:FIST C-terminal domain-containing protein [Leptospiraceae bacterium]MCP5494455.1 FIST C-terminal domain-containing protein [Leptospiraceae bacterium]
MKAFSVSTHAVDPYRAGLEMGEKLKNQNVEVIFLFSSIHYGDKEDLLDGIYEGLENEEVVIIGNSGDGFYESSEVGNMGAAALGLNSEGVVSWHITHVEDVEKKPAEKTKELFSNMQELLGNRKATFMFLASDFRVDASEIEKIISMEIDVPIIGGLAADDNQMLNCALFKNQSLLKNSIVLLAAVGPINFEISVGNSLTNIGNVGTISEAKGKNIIEIDGTSAMDFIERETGKVVLRSDRGVTSLSIIDSDEPQIKRLRSIVPDFSMADGSLGLYGGIETGKKVQVCNAEPDKIIQEVYAIAEKQKEKGIEPIAALIVSCAGRKWILGDKIEHEVKALTKEFGFSLPLAGFPSFGEIGPLWQEHGYSRNLFHNMTYVLMLIGK